MKVTVQRKKLVNDVQVEATTEDVWLFLGRITKLTQCGFEVTTLNGDIHNYNQSDLRRLQEGPLRCDGSGYEIQVLPGEIRYAKLEDWVECKEKPEGYYCHSEVKFVDPAMIECKFFGQP